MEDGERTAGMGTRLEESRRIFPGDAPSVAAEEAGGDQVRDHGSISVRRWVAAVCWPDYRAWWGKRLASFLGLFQSITTEDGMTRSRKRPSQDNAR